MRNYLSWLGKVEVDSSFWDGSSAGASERVSERPLEVFLQDLSGIESWKRLSVGSVVGDVDTSDESDFDSVRVSASSVEVVLSGVVVEKIDAEGL